MTESQGSNPPARRRREPLKAAPVEETSASTSSEVVPARRARGGLFSNVGRAVGVMTAVSRELAQNTAEVSQQVLGAAAERRPARDIASTVVNGTINGAVRAATVIQDETGIQVVSGAAAALMDVDADDQGQRARGSGFAKAASNLVEQVTHLAESAAGAAGGVASEAGHFMDHGVGSAKDIREELRFRGRELLRRSTQLDDPDEHPAFRGIIGELAPDEARIIRYLAHAGAQPVVGLLEVDKMKKSTRELARNISFVGLESGCLRPQMTSVYLDNLARLGVVHMRDFKSGPQEQYEVLYAEPEIVDAPAPVGRFVKHQLVERSVELSYFGRSLYDMCFAPDGPEDTDASEEATA